MPRFSEDRRVGNSLKWLKIVSQKKDLPNRNDISGKSINFATEWKGQLYIIGGCNGAGKTTASYTVLPEILECREFVNADEIARGLSPFNPESVAVEAGRLMLRRISQLLLEGENFSIETTLSTRSYAKLIDRAHQQGYKIHLLYFWLSSPELAILRVAQRVSEGGHNIPEEVIRRRCKLGIKNLSKIFIPIVDDWYLYDNSNMDFICVAQGMKGSSPEIFLPNIYTKIFEL